MQRSALTSLAATFAAWAPAAARYGPNWPAGQPLPCGRHFPALEPQPNLREEGGAQRVGLWQAACAMPVGSASRQNMPATVTSAAPASLAVHQRHGHLTYRLWSCDDSQDWLDPQVGVMLAAPSCRPTVGLYPTSAKPHVDALQVARHRIGDHQVSQRGGMRGSCCDIPRSVAREGRGGAMGASSVTPQPSFGLRGSQCTG